MSEYTPEPWVIREDNPEFATFVVLAKLSGTDKDASQTRILSLHPANLGRAEATANAVRIVAAVNACEGIPTDLLEKLPPGALADVIEAARTR